MLLLVWDKYFNVNNAAMFSPGFQIVSIFGSSQLCENLIVFFRCATKNLIVRSHQIDLFSSCRLNETLVSVSNGWKVLRPEKVSIFEKRLNLVSSMIKISSLLFISDFGNILVKHIVFLKISTYWLEILDNIKSWSRLGLEIWTKLELFQVSSNPAL